MPTINIEVLDCVIAGGLLILLLSFLLKLVNTQKQNEFEGLQELKPKSKEVKNDKHISGNSDMPVNKSQFPKKKQMEPPPSLKNDISKISTESKPNNIDQNIPKQSIISSSLKQQPAPLNIYLAENK
tara:strand:+ start:3351 stop:3731 length:381 start_codon:yes stop_codon:yes gene_type:complete